MGYVMNINDAADFADFLGIRTRIKGDEVNFEYCPSCLGGKHKDKWTFSVNGNTGAFCCLRGSCGYKGHFVELCRDYEYDLPGYESTPKVYRQFAINDKPLTVEDKITASDEDTAITYFEGRGISAKTVRAYGITSNAKRGRPDIILIPHYDENGVLTSIKWRNANYTKGCGSAKEWWEEDCKQILFGIDHLNKENHTMVLTEGQIDALSLAEAGISNAYSVPGGMQNFNWVNFNGDWIREHFNTIIIFGDNERNEITLYDEVVKRFPDLIIKRVRQCDYLGEKDANDILNNPNFDGKNSLWKAYNNAEVPKPSYVFKLANVEYTDEDATPKTTTGIYSVDRVLGGGICSGELVVMTGYSGTGKSTLASHMIAAMTATGKETERPIIVYSGETTPERFKRNFDRQMLYEVHKGDKAYICGCLNQKRNKYGDVTYDMSADEVIFLTALYRDKVLFHDQSLANINDGTLIEQIEKEVDICKPSIVLVDNLMTLVEGAGEDLNNAQSTAVGALKRMAVKYDMSVILVAHPRKQTNSKKPNTLDNMSEISGSADITNKADVVISLIKGEGGGGDTPTDKRTLRVIKNRRYGTEATAQLLFNPDTLTYVDTIQRADDKIVEVADDTTGS